MTSDVIFLTAPCFEDVSHLAGHFLDVGDDWLIVRPCDGLRVVVNKPSGDCLISVWRGAISPELCALAEKCYMRAGKTVSTNRGYAAGATKRDLSYKTFEKGSKANSGIMGFMDSANMTHPCRLTQFSRKHFQEYQEGLPFVQRMDECFATLMPDAHLRQKNVATKTRFHIEGTAYSTITVNYNFRTALHVDSGDFKEGFGTLAVCQRDITGGWILFPGFKTAVVLEHGDFVAMDVHEFHCNTDIELVNGGAFRLSFVGYLREKMVQCEDVNKRIAAANVGEGNGTLTSERMIADISAADGGMGAKTVTGTGPQGLSWWTMQGQRYDITYKFKRYVILDKVTKKKYLRLTTAWDEITQPTNGNI